MPNLMMVSSLDHVVGQTQNKPWHRQVQGLRGSHVDDQLELGGLLHRQVGRLRALQDLVRLDGGPPDSLMASPASHGVSHGDQRQLHPGEERLRGHVGDFADAEDRICLGASQEGVFVERVTQVVIV